MAPGDSQDQDKTGCHYLGKMDVVCGYCVEKGFKHRSKAISQAQIGKSSLTLEACAAARGMLPKA